MQAAAADPRASPATARSDETPADAGPGPSSSTPVAGKKQAKKQANAEADVFSDEDDEDVSMSLPQGGNRKGKRSRKSDARAGSRGRERERGTSFDSSRRSASHQPPGEGDSFRKDVGEQSEQEDDEAESEDGEGDALAEDEFTRQQAIYAAQQRNMGLLSQIMDEEQLERHMASRRGTLNKANVRKLVNHVLFQSVNQHIVMAASGVGKVFVGEMVERARGVQAERGDSGALQPVHLYEAYRRYKNEQERPGNYPPGGSGAAGLGKRRRMF